MCSVVGRGIVLLDGRARKEEEEMNQTAGQLIADLESEFGLLLLERYMADLERRDERLIEEIDA
jgi:hypothetical protein